MSMLHILECGIIEYCRLLRIKKKYDRSCRIYTTAIGKNTKIGRNVYLPQGVSVRGNCVIGDYSYCSKGTVLFDGTKIGNFCSIGYNCQIGAPEHPLGFLSTSPSVYRMDKEICDILSWPLNDCPHPVEIENDVWIGSNAVILQGVKIGNGAVIGAGAIVNKDVEPFSIVGGVPAKLIRYRFPDKERYWLECTEWWNQDLDKIKQIALDFSRKESIE